MLNPRPQTYTLNPRPQQGGGRYLLTVARVVDTCWVMASTAVTMAGLMLMAGRKLCRKGSSSSVAPGKGGACVGTRGCGRLRV